MVIRGIHLLLRLLFFGLATLGFYALYITAKAFLISNVYYVTPFLMFTSVYTIAATCGYLFLGVRIRHLLPLQQAKIIGFILILWITDIVSRTFFFALPHLQTLGYIGVPAEDTPRLVIGILTTSVFPLFMMWSVRRLSAAADRW